MTGTGVGQLRTVETIDGKVIIERLDATDNARRQYRYSGVTGMGASNYTGDSRGRAEGQRHAR